MKKFNILSKKNVFKGYFSIDRYKVNYEKFDGTYSAPVYREVFERGSAVAVLPYDPTRKEVILIEQFRIGAIKDPNPWLLEVVAGIIEPNESLESVAIRETKEEAGLSIKKLLPIYKYWVTPGACTEHIDLFCGIVDTTTAGGIHGIENEQEDIQVHVLSIEEALDWLRLGKIKNSTAIIALQWLALNHHKIKMT